jgi:hypothetical protein
MMNRVVRVLKRPDTFGNLSSAQTIEPGVASQGAMQRALLGLS